MEVPLSPQGLLYEGTHRSSRPTIWKYPWVVKPYYLEVPIGSQGLLYGGTLRFSRPTIWRYPWVLKSCNMVVPFGPQGLLYGVNRRFSSDIVWSYLWVLSSRPMRHSWMGVGVSVKIVSSPYLQPSGHGHSHSHLILQRVLWWRFVFWDFWKLNRVFLTVLPIAKKISALKKSLSALLNCKVYPKSSDGNSLSTLEGDSGYEKCSSAIIERKLVKNTHVTHCWCWETVLRSAIIRHLLRDSINLHGTLLQLQNLFSLFSFIILHHVFAKRVNKLYSSKSSGIALGSACRKNG